jgi:hypothetical protein
MNQFAAFSILENLEPDRLVLTDTCKTIRSGTLDSNDRLGEDPRRRAGTPVRFHRLGIQMKNFPSNSFDFNFAIVVDLLLVSRIVEICVVIVPVQWHGV